jgi:alpha-glucosidase
MRLCFAILFVLPLLLVITVSAQKNKTFQLRSPDGRKVVSIEAGKNLQWSLMNGSTQVITPSAMSMHLQSGDILGVNMQIKSSKMEKVNTTIKAFDYIKDIIPDVYNQLTITCKGDYGIIFRAYDDGVAYRFFTKKNEELIMLNEEATFNFDKDYKCFVPFVRDFRGAEQYIQSFEALYTERKLTDLPKDTLGFLPIMVDLGNGQKALITEADLEDYPGMFLQVNNSQPNSFKAVYAPYPLAQQQGGHKMINTIVTKRADFIAKVNGTRNFPWRVVIVSDHDTALLDNDMVQKLASPSRIEDPSWIKPGKVAWDWWNDWNISHVDFRAGVNTETYKYYIDFAAANKLQYIIMDEGWSNDLDLLDVSPKINLQEIINYGKQKNVDVILWAAWYAVQSNMDAVFEKYASMGAKGFKIDFMDRDDQVMVSSLYAIAKKAAENKMILDYHGMYKPTGLQRTWPNIVNCEGVKGMENVKWTPHDDVPRYDVSIPFIRMVAGPMDYTPGAMRNSIKSGFAPNNSMPVSQGTRCHQLAMYIVFVAPLQMLSDNPTVYMKEQESTDFIDNIPTTFDKTVPLAGEVAAYTAIAREKNNVWYVGAMTNWNERDLDLDFSFLGAGSYEAEIFKDGINADRDATDYKKEIVTITRVSKLKIHLAPGGGWAARIVPLNK